MLTAMNKFIYNTNQYLLERFPNIWNTKIVWMLGISAIVHLVFYILGFIALSNVETLHEKRNVEIFFENGSIFFSILISILLIVIWLTQMFKNNGFKNFYPTSKYKLFLQFVYYFIIVFVSCTFYFSYMFGLKHYINLTYEDDVFVEEVNNANKAAVFLSHNLNDYMINHRKYPSPYDTIYCETNSGLVDGRFTYLEYFDKSFQFYTLRKEIIDFKDVYSNENIQKKGYVYFITSDSTRTYYYKENVVDIKDLHTSYQTFPLSFNEYSYEAEPSYFNFSNAFYKLKNGNDNDYSEFEFDYLSTYPYQKKKNSIERTLRNKSNHDLLSENDATKIKNTLETFLSYCSKYNIETNISVEKWYNIINTGPEYKIKALIGQSKPIKGEFQFAEERTALEEYIDEITTDYYIKSEDLETAFKNIDTIKNHTVINGSIHVFLWIAFSLSILIFCFRISNLRTFIFSIIAGVVLFLFTLLIIAIYGYLVKGDFSEYFAMYLTLIISTIVLIIPLFYKDKFRKLLVGVCLNLTIAGFIPYVLLILAIITSHQSDYCRSLVFEERDCFVLLNDIGFVTTSVFLFVSALVFMYFYASIIKQWRALTEQ